MLSNVKGRLVSISARYGAPVGAMLALSQFAHADGDLASSVTPSITAAGTTVTTIGAAVLGVVVLLLVISFAKRAMGK